MRRQPSSTTSPPAGRLLLVDDNEDLRHSVAEMLTDGGWQVVQAGSAEEALELAAAKRFAVLVSDVSMPGSSGVELVERLRRQIPSLRCLLISAEHDRQDVQRQVEVGAASFLAKPFSRNQLLTAVDGLPVSRPVAGGPRLLALAALLVLGIAAAGWWVQQAPPSLPRPVASAVTRGSHIVPITPLGEQLTVPHELAWREAEGAAEYRLSLRAVDERLLWQGQVASSPASLPEAARRLLRSGVTYYWQVEALDRDGARLAWSSPVRFRLAVEAAAVD